MTDTITLPRSVIKDVADAIERYQVKRQDFDTFDGVLKPLLDSLLQPIIIQPEFTTGHCSEKKKPGGCKLHNIFCGFPDCDRKKVKI
jgi:hypothetical protein